MWRVIVFQVTVKSNSLTCYVVCQKNYPKKSVTLKYSINTRNIKISERSFPNQCFAQVMKDQKKEIWGTIICQENDCDLSQLEEEFVQSYQQLYDKDDKIYLTKYAPQNGLQISPRLQDNEDFVTHKGTVYLQSYLDELGPLNTFG
eukprot:TRINITY_DN30864_c0_g1_i10.p1 TRINITY_DN30864_c0_g1~~TRINITY_DN30864_c0_g1_i10.p1  ORF type:complete len:168 (+),score=4.35 TRINITY_DN30864_c0_g1_i10:68-505(+)